MYIDDSVKLSRPMGQFEMWCGKLYHYWSVDLGWRYVKGL